MSQPANTTTTTRVIIDYAVKVEYDKSPMKTGEKREVKFYNPETKTAKNGKVNTSSDCISIDYEEGKDTFSVTALKEGKAEINIDTDTQTKVFNILLSLPDMEKSKGVSLGNTLMKIELKSDMLGECKIELTEKGFLSTNIGGYNSSYLIGCDEIDMIIESIKNEIM